jgi:hypothetical protein
MSVRWLAVFGIVLATVTSAAAEKRKFEGYAEWRHGDALVVDGQRILMGERTEFKGKGEAKTFTDIPLGYEVKVEADRVTGGWLARKLEAKPNGSAFFEDELRKEFDEIEERFRDTGRVFEEDEETGEREDYGRLVVYGPGWLACSACSIGSSRRTSTSGCSGSTLSRTRSGTRWRRRTGASSCSRGCSTTPTTTSSQ